MTANRLPTTIRALPSVGRVSVAGLLIPPVCPTVPAGAVARPGAVPAGLPAWSTASAIPIATTCASTRTSRSTGVRGDEALAAARDLDRPILLSVGYASCHWCHVMSHESFDDPSIAAFLNENFVAIKDRQQRPDLDAVFMTATQAMNNGAGGWPMTAFLDPRRGGRSSPAPTSRRSPRGGQPSFRQVLEAMAEGARSATSLRGSADYLVQVLTQRDDAEAAGPKSRENNEVKMSEIATE